MSAPTDRTPFTPAPHEVGPAFHGVHVAACGEDGDYVLLGHHEPRRALAALLGALRNDLGSDYREEYSGLTEDNLTRGRATFTCLNGRDRDEWYIDETLPSGEHSVDVTWFWT